MSTRNGYMRLPTKDLDTSESPGYGAASVQAAGGLSSRRKKVPKNLKPGLFYMFGERGKYATNQVSTALDQSESEVEGERIELTDFKPRKVRTRRNRAKSPKTPKSGGPTGRSLKPKIVVIEEPILPDDTVQRVALRYGTHAAEIRRVNNLYKDQDFFALKTVKIPVKEHSVLTETQMREKCRKNAVDEASATSGNQSSGGATADELRLGGPAAYYKSDEEREESSGDADDEVDDSDTPEYRDVSIQSALKWKHSSHALLHKFDEELQKIRENTEQKRNSNLKEVALRMESPTIYPIITQNDQLLQGNRYFFLNCRLRVVLALALLLAAGLFLLLFLVATGTVFGSKS